VKKEHEQGRALHSELLVIVEEAKRLIERPAKQDRSRKQQTSQTTGSAFIESAFEQWVVKSEANQQLVWVGINENTP